MADRCRCRRWRRSARIAPTPAAARARRPGRVLPARALPHAGPGGRARGHRVGRPGLRTRGERRRPLRSSSGSAAGLLPRSTREHHAAASAGTRCRRRAAHHLPAAGARRARRRPCSSPCPSCSGPRPAGRGARPAARRWCWPGCWSPASQGFAGSLAVGAAAAVAADLVLVLPERPTLGGLLVVFGARLPRRRAAADVPRARGSDLVASLSGVGAAAVRGRARWPRCCCSAGRRARGRALVALLAVGAALVVGHLVDLVLPRPQLAPGVPRGLLGLVAGGAGRRRGDFLGRRRRGDLSGALGAAVYGGGARRRGRAGRARRRATSSSRPTAAERPASGSRRRAVGAAGHPGGAAARRLRARSPSPLLTIL